MVTINTIDDLARILREQPAWVDTLRSLILTEDLLDLPARFDRFVQSQEETNRSQEETNRRLSETLSRQSELLAELKEISDDSRQRLGRLEGRVDRMEGRFGNLEGGQYERTIRAKALARSQLNLGLDAAYYALSQDGIIDPRLTRAIGRALREKIVTTAETRDLYEADLIVSDETNRHAVFEVSLTTDDSDIQRAKQRAEILEAITGGPAVPVVITARIDGVRYDQANAEGVTVFVIPYP